MPACPGRRRGWGSRCSRCCCSACLTATSAPGPRPSEAGVASAPLGQTELLLYQSVVANVRSGTPYYVAAAEAHRVAHAPLKPYTTVRLPTLAVVQAAVSPLLVTALLPLLVSA
ncbi:hypothetical protein QP185_15495 [Sphingomonas aerolata]|uniref:hypothetical protein n=1 Tax=Sphingomonas aerolata TaxID=185951 RepID=UPI002FE1ED5F